MGTNTYARENDRQLPWGPVQSHVPGKADLCRYRGAMERGPHQAGRISVPDSNSALCGVENNFIYPVPSCKPGSKGEP